MRNQTILVDINKETCKILKYKQYDNNNILQIIVEENYKKINLNEYVGFAFFELPSGLIIKKKCEIEDNVITIIIDNNVLSEEGKVLLDLTLSDGEDIFTLFRINLVIEETIDRDEAIIIEAGWDIVAEIAKFDKAEEQRVTNEEQRVANENVRITNETDRQNEEMKRITNENARVVKESERLINEQERVNAEELRIENEELRQESEAGRIIAENSRINRFNEMEALVNGVESEINELQTDVSELQTDMTNARTQSFTVTDTYNFIVDHEGMMPSLVTFNNIEGLSSVETNSKGNKEIVSRSVNHICTIDKSKNYFDDAVQDTLHGDTTTATRENNDITVISSTQYGAVAYSIPNLEEGKKYCILCDDIIITQGEAHFQAATPAEYKPLRSTIDLQSSHYNAVFIGNELCTTTFHCCHVSTSGNVTYKNVQIYEVKEMIIPDIQLNSLPNGVKDEIKDGMLIKRTGYVNLAELNWIASSTNSQFSNSEFVVYYTHSISDLIIDPDAYDVERREILCNILPNVPMVETSSAQNNPTYNRVGISGHSEWSEFRIKVYRNDAPDVESFSTWLANNNVHAVYELENPEYIPIGLTIKTDKGDTVVINTTKTMDLTYDIQLNTRAQIDTLQETVGGIRSELQDNIDVLQNDVKYTLEYDQHGNGYYILPGGLMFQFGYITFPANYNSSETIDFILTFPVPFPNKAFSITASMSGGDNGWDSKVSAHPLNNSQARAVIRGLNYTITNTLYWFAIGR